MNEPRNPRDQEIIQLLQRWKQGDAPYPASLQDKRRDAFLAMLPLAPAVHPTAGPVAQTPMPLAMQVTLGILSSVIMVMSVLVANTIHRNWDILTGNATATVANNLPFGATNALFPNFGADGATPTFAPTGTAISPTATLTMTPVPPLQGTPQPSVVPTNPGHHYGQTKTPKPRQK